MLQTKDRAGSKINQQNKDAKERVPSESHFQPQPPHCPPGGEHCALRNKPARGPGGDHLRGPVLNLSPLGVGSGRSLPSD